MAQRKSPSSTKGLYLKTIKDKAPVMVTKINYNEFGKMMSPINEKLEKTFESLKKITGKYSVLLKGEEENLYKDIEKKIDTEITIENRLLKIKIPLLREFLKQWMLKYSLPKVPTEADLPLVEMHRLLNQWLRNHPLPKEQEELFSLQHMYQTKKGIKTEFKTIKD